jgi:hypothetical protein
MRSIRGRRLRENPMAFHDETFPIAIIEDRYSVYAGGSWLAIAQADILHDGLPRITWCLSHGPFAGDIEAAEFWASPPNWIAVGQSPDHVLEVLEVNFNKSAIS